MFGISPRRPSMTHMNFARCKRRILPAGRRKRPARPREQPIFPALEGSRYRIRLLRVLSHSHGRRKNGFGKRSARKQASRAYRAQNIPAGTVFSLVCRLHNVCALHCMEIYSLFAAFSPSYQNDCAFSSIITGFTRLRMDFPLLPSYNALKVSFFAAASPSSFSFEFAIALHSPPVRTLTGGNVKRMIYAY